MLYTFMIFSFIIIYCTISNSVILKEAHVVPVSKGDLGMIFLLKLENSDCKRYEVSVRKIQCCEYLPGQDKDCDMVDLIGGEMGIIEAKTVKLISVISPSLYLNERAGVCHLSIKYISDTSEVGETMAHVKYTTTCNSGTCETVDLDAGDQCQPVDCQMKYLGSRSFFSWKWRRCQKVPICISNPESDLPDVVYSASCNCCQDLTNCVSKFDLKMLDKTEIESYNDSCSALNIHCHEGYYSTEVGGCVCKDGWTSPPKNPNYIPGVGVYHMCNIEIATWYQANKARVRIIGLVVGIISVCLVILIIMLVCCLHILYNCMKSAEFRERKTYSEESFPGEVDGNMNAYQYCDQSACWSYIEGQADEECAADCQGYSDKDMQELEDRN